MKLKHLMALFSLRIHDCHIMKWLPIERDHFIAKNQTLRSGHSIYFVY